jgi:mono/diheme cytochrome c family protein
MRNWILALVSLLIMVGCGDKSDDSGSSSVSDGGESLAGAGAAIYSGRCAVCHGSDGERISTASLVTFVPNSSEAELTDIVTNGKPGTSMPAFASSLTGEEIADVVQFLLSEWGSG